MFGFLLSDLNFYYRTLFFAIFWNRHKIPNTKIHFLCPTTKFCLRARISEPCRSMRVSPTSMTFVIFCKNLRKIYASKTKDFGTCLHTVKLSKIEFPIFVHLLILKLEFSICKLGLRLKKPKNCNKHIFGKMYPKIENIFLQ